MTQLSDEDILALAEYIRRHTNPDECCHALLFTRRWLAERYGRVDPGTIVWLKSQEVACDCELANHLAASILKRGGKPVSE
jgi:hypothetical protein